MPDLAAALEALRIDVDAADLRASGSDLRTRVKVRTRRRQLLVAAAAGPLIAATVILLTSVNASGPQPVLEPLPSPVQSRNPSPTESASLPAPSSAVPKPSGGSPSGIPTMPSTGMPSTAAGTSPVQASLPPAPARALTGSAPHSTGVRLLTFTPVGIATAQAGIFTLDSGSIVAVRGLPVGCMGDGFRLASPDRWVVGWRPYGSAADPCTGPGRVYVVDAAAGTARVVVSAAGNAAPAEADSFWTLTAAAPAATPGGPAPQQVQHFDVTGALLGSYQPEADRRS